MKLNFRLCVLLSLMMFTSNALAGLVTHDYMDITYVDRISKFRSGAGHDFSYDPFPISIGFYETETDPTETNRSMKHYFEPGSAYRGDNGTVPLYAPFQGSIYRVSNEGHDSGFVNKQVWIQSAADPDVFAIIFHANLSESYPQAWNDYPQAHWIYYEPDDLIYDTLSVAAGDCIGYADLRSTISDIAILRRISDTEYHYLSYFDPSIMSADVFSQYQARGIASPTDVIISKAFRDAHPITDWDVYNPDDWVELSPVTVPLPSSLLLAGLGTSLAAYMRRRRSL